MPQHTYHNTVISLSSAVPQYDKHVESQNASYSPIYTSDDGTTWHIDFRNIHLAYHS